MEDNEQCEDVLLGGLLSELHRESLLLRQTFRASGLSVRGWNGSSHRLSGEGKVEKRWYLRNTSVVKRSPAPARESDIRTRDLVARAILETGPATAADLAAKLSITPAGIRRHLDSLLAEGILISREEHQSSARMRGRGRPAKVFVMTDEGREKFNHSYDDLAVAALKFISSQPGELVAQFAAARAEDLLRKTSSALASLPEQTTLTGKVENVSALLFEEGYASSVVEKTNGVEICQHHCPIAHVASEFPELCEAETEAISRALGTHVQRLATIAHGDGVCTTFVPKQIATASQNSADKNHTKRARKQTTTKVGATS